MGKRKARMEDKAEAGTLQAGEPIFAGDFFGRAFSF
jgi:hypothetical protein